MPLGDAAPHHSSRRWRRGWGEAALEERNGSAIHAAILYKSMLAILIPTLHNYV